jgi:signal peptidase I
MYAEFLIALTIRSFLFQPFSIPSGAGVPTLLIGDYVFASKYAYGYSRYSFPPGEADFPGRIMAMPPKRGDVVVFKLPKDGRTDYIKRLVGLPGDRIQMIQGRLYINGEAVQRDALPPYRMADLHGRPVDVPHYLETLPGGLRHEIIQNDGDTGYLSNTPVYTVPPAHYFMMGDNRDNSLDSRMLGEVGYVPFENLEGRAEIIYFSLDPDARAWNAVRWGRIFLKIE